MSDKAKCPNFNTIYCDFSESDRQKLEMWDEMVDFLNSIRDIGADWVNSQIEDFIERAKKIQEEE
jgi:hypothetical protein